MDFDYRGPQSPSRAELRAWQDGRLRSLLAEISTNRFYQEKFGFAGLKMSEARGAADLSALPFTTKSELAAEQFEHPPYGRLLTYPLSRYRYLHQTSGTTGRPLRWLDTAEDWETFLRCWVEVYRGAGVTENDLVFCAFSFGPYVSHWTGIEGARHVGALAISGGGMSSEQRLRAILDNRCTVLVCTPTYALHLAEVAARLELDLRSSDIRVTIHAGEPGASVPNVKRRIEEAWGARCFDHAGATEVGAWAFDCQAEDGAIHLNELEFIFEAIDPKTCVAVDEGARGELVITSLGRADDMLSVRGVNVYPSAIDDLIRAVPSIVEYEVEIRRESEMDDLLLKIETDGRRPFAEVERAILAAFRAQLNIRVSVVQALAGSLPRYEFKARRYKRVAE